MQQPSKAEEAWWRPAPRVGREKAGVLPTAGCHSLWDPESASAIHAFLSLPQFPFCPAELAGRGTVRLTSVIPGWPLEPREGRCCRGSVFCAPLNNSLRLTLFPAAREGGERFSAWARQTIYSPMLKRTTATEQRYQGKRHSSFNPDGSILAKRWVRRAANTGTFPGAILRHLQCRE